MTSRVIPSLRQGSWVLALFALTTAAAYLQASAGQQSGSSTSNASSSEIAAHRTLLDQYCVTCHNQALTSGSPGVVDDPSALRVQLRHLGLTLDDADVANVAGDPGALGERRPETSVSAPCRRPQDRARIQSRMTASGGIWRTSSTERQRLGPIRVERRRSIG